MLKALALTLLVATFLASGFTLVPADTVRPGPISFTQSETFISENLTVIPVAEEEMTTTETNARFKTDREDIPKT